MLDATCDAAIATGQCNACRECKMKLDSISREKRRRQDGGGASTGRSRARQAPQVRTYLPDQAAIMLQQQMGFPSFHNLGTACTSIMQYAWSIAESSRA